MRLILTLVLLTAVLCTSVPPSVCESPRPTTVVPPPWKHTLGLNRVRQSHLDIYSGYRKKFSRPEGVAAVKLHFNDDVGRGDDDELTVYGVNSGSGEIFYNKSMLNLGFFGQEAGEKGMFGEAVGIAADEHGNVFVVDRGAHRLLHLRTSERNVLGYVKSFDLSGSEQPLRAPTDAALESQRLFVTDTGNDRIVEVDFEGRIIGQIGKGIGLFKPYGIDVIASEDWNFFGSRFIAVTDSLNQRISILSLTGELIGRATYKEISDRPGGFFFVAIDYYSNIYVTDRIGGCIYKFDRYLRLLTRVGCGVSSKDDLVEPRGIAIYRRFGQIFVAEKAGASYFWVGTDVQNLRCTGAREDDRVRIAIRFLLTEQSWVTVRLESEKGETIKTLSNKKFMNPGGVELDYRLPADEAPCPIANCTYTIRIHAQPTYSSSEFHSIDRSSPVRGL